MIGKEWPYRVPLREDELLSSFLIRNAHAHGTTPYSFLSYHWPGRPFWNRDTDRVADRAWLNELEVCTGVSAHRLEASTLLSLRRDLGSTLPNGDTPLLLSVSVFHRTRRRYGLLYCPACFAEGRRWYRRIWRLGFVFVCSEHGELLLDACPACGSPIVPHRSMYLDLTRCHRCGGPLSTSQGGMVPPPDVLALQRYLLQVLAGGSNRVGPFDHTEVLSSVRGLLSVLTSRRVHTALRAAFRLPAAQLPVDRLQFEHARTSERILLLETLMAWMSDWPSTFRTGARSAGLTQRAFARIRQPSTLQGEVARLPSGFTRGRRAKFVPRVFDRELLRLSRTDIAAYRALRAKRLQVLAGFA